MAIADRCSDFARRIWLLPKLEMAVALPTKCGCTSLKEACARFGDRKHLTRLLRSDDPVPDRWLKVCPVRSPWDRVMSCWADKVMGTFRPDLAEMGCWPCMPFADFVALVAATPDHLLDRHLMPQHYLIRSPRWSGPDILLRVETMAQDWERVRAFRPMLPALPRLNVSAAKAGWTRATVTAIAERYAEDIALLGYEPPC